MNQFVPVLSCKKVFASNVLEFTRVALMLITLLAASQLAVNMGEARSFMLIVGLLVFYYSGASWWLRRKNSPDVILPQYLPPDGMSPGAVRYLLTGNSDNKTLAAVLVDLASRGLVSMEPQTFSFSITKRTNTLPGDLPEEERAALDAMFNGVVQYKSVLTGAVFEQPAPPCDNFLFEPVEGTNAAELGFAVQHSLRSQMEGKYFTRNLAIVLPGVALSTFLLVLAVARAQAIRMGEPSAPFLGLLIVTASVVAVILLIGYLPRADELLRGRVHATGDVKIMVALLYGYLCFLAFLFTETPSGYYALILVTLLNIALPARLLRTPTRLGRERLDQLEGFRQFLTAVELDKFHRLMRPNWTPSLSVSNLAYALSIDLENVWADFLRVCHLKPTSVGGLEIPPSFLLQKASRLGGDDRDRP